MTRAATAPERLLRIGIAGLGQAGRALVEPIVRHSRCVIAAAAEPNEAPRSAFARDHGVPVFGTLEAMCDSDAVDLVYIATPTHLHAVHAMMALAAGKHVIVEKPMALTLDECDAMASAAREHGLTLIVGHSQSYEAPIRAMAEFVRGGTLGKLGMVNTWCFSDWLYRPRTPEELDTTLGGGVVFRQGAHQVDIVRWIAGDAACSVRAAAGRWDASRTTEGSLAAFIDFEGGAVATVVYSGYDHLPGHELTFGIGESGRPSSVAPGSARARLTAADEPAQKRRLAYGGRSADEAPPEASFYGLTVVSCEQGDIRQVPGGLRVYGDSGVFDTPVPATPTGRDVMLGEAAAAILDGIPPVHDGSWGAANLEVCLAILESSRTRREIGLKRQRLAPGLARGG